MIYSVAFVFVIARSNRFTRASAFAKDFGTKYAGEEEQPNASKASTCDSNVEH